MGVAKLDGFGSDVLEMRNSQDLWIDCLIDHAATF